MNGRRFSRDYSVTGRINKRRSNRHLKQSLRISAEELARYLVFFRGCLNSEFTRTPYRIVRSRQSLSRSLQRLRNQKSASFNIFKLLVPQEKVEIVVHDTPKKMQRPKDEELQQLNVEQLLSQKSDGKVRADGTRDVEDLDVILMTDDESSLGKQNKTVNNVDEPEIVLLDETPQHEKQAVSISEVVCLQELKVTDESKQETVSRSQSEDLIILEDQPSTSYTDVRVRNFLAARNSRNFFQGAVKHTVSSTISSRNPHSLFPKGLPVFPAPVYLPSALPSSSFTTNMPKFVDLLSEGTWMIFKRMLRKWVAVQEGAITDGKPLRICSYNVLCQATARKTPELYTHLTMPGRAAELVWKNRSDLLAREFSMIDADVFCLQEVQYDHYDQFYRPFFEKSGYRGEYKKRTREMLDGCAIFYKNYLQPLRYQPIEYFVSELSLLDRDNVGQLIRLKDTRSGRDLCIANTHLLFNKRRGDVKLAQLATLLANIDRECGPESGQECPYILCGDFNIEPLCPLYNFIVNGGICFTGLRRGAVSGQGDPDSRFVSADLMPANVKIARNCRFKDLNRSRGTGKFPSRNCWSHPLRFNSIYLHIDAESGMPEVSTFHSLEAGNPDFIFYSLNSKKLLRPRLTNPTRGLPINTNEEGLHLIRRLSLPTLQQLQTTLGPWPNAVTPSDHIPLIGDFVLQ